FPHSQGVYTSSKQEYLRHPWIDSSFAGATRSSEQFASAEQKTRLFPAWLRPSLLKRKSSSKTFRRCATLKPSASCSSPWVPKLSLAMAAHSTAPASVAACSL